MKKILALLLALVMALSCVGAFAEDAQANTVEVPAFTVSFESTVDVDALMALLPMLGVDEYTAAMAQLILPLLADTNGQLVFADNGAQLDLGLKGQTVLTVAGEQVEGGIALASDILPSYVLTLSNETIEELMKQFTSQTETETSIPGVDMNALTEKMTEYVTQFIGAAIGAVSFGDPEIGEYTFEDLEMTFNCMAPIIVDTDAIKAALETLIDQIKNDESFGALINATGTVGMPAAMSEETITMPDEVNAAVYTNVDAEGNAVGEDTLVAVNTVTTAEGQTVSVNVIVVVNSEGIAVAVNIPEQDITISVAFNPTEDGGAAINCTLQAQGIAAAETLVFSMGEVIQIYSETFVMDLEKPLITCTVAIAQDGERDFAVLDENKTAVSVEELMADSEGQIIGGLLADVMSNGLGAVITKAAEIMPEEVGALMTLMAPQAAEEAAE